MSEVLNVPGHWEVKKLGEVCEIIMGQSPPSTTYNLHGTGLPFFQGKAEFTDLYPVVEKWCAVPKKVALPNDILLSVRAPVGTTNIANLKCCIGRGLAAIRYENYKYVFYFLRSIVQQLDKQGTGTTFRAISGETIRATEIPLPPLTEQRAIVAKIEELLSDLENGKQQLQTAQQQLKIYRQSLLKAAFEGKLTNKNVKEGELPKGWKWVKLGVVARKITDGEHITPRRTSDGFLLLSARNIQNGYLALSDVDHVPADEYERIVKRCNPEFGDILISCSGSIGRVCRVPNNLNFVMVRSVALVKFDWEKNSSKFYEYLFQSPLLQRQIEKSKKATAQANLFLGPIKNLDIIVCPLEEQHAIVSALESKLTICDNISATITQSLAQAETLRQSILKKAFEGKLV